MGVNVPGPVPAVRRGTSRGEGCGRRRRWRVRVAGQRRLNGAERRRGCAQRLSICSASGPRGHHVDDARNLIRCTCVECRNPAQRLPIIAVRKPRPHDSVGSRRPGRNASAARCCVARTAVRRPAHAGLAIRPEGKPDALCIGSFDYLADGHHVDDAETLSACTYVDCREPAERFPISRLKKGRGIFRTSESVGRRVGKGRRPAPRTAPPPSFPSS